MDDKEIIDEFNKIYYNRATHTWREVSWLGVKVQNNPCDLWIVQEIICDKKPDFIIECGTLFAGGALYLCSICELIDHGLVITIDRRFHTSIHKRMTTLTGLTTAGAILDEVRARVGDGSVMVLLDSDHRKDNVLKELKIYSDIVTLGQYLVVQDTHINGHPVLEGFGDGPCEAVAEFLATDERFKVDRWQERLMLTFNPMGYLRKIKV